MVANDDLEFRYLIIMFKAFFSLVILDVFLFPFFTFIILHINKVIFFQLYEEDPSRFGTPVRSLIEPVSNKNTINNLIDLMICYFKVEEDYEVEKILEKKKTSNGATMYLVKWKNFDDPADYTWEPLENLESVQDMVDQFDMDLEDNSI